MPYNYYIIYITLTLGINASSLNAINKSLSLLIFILYAYILKVLLKG